MSQHENCHVEPVEKPLDRTALGRAAAVYLAVSGMGCHRCAMRVNNSLLRLNGVIESNVYFEQGFAAVAYDPARVDIPAMLQAVAYAGREAGHEYQARVITQLAANDTYQQ